MRLAATSVILSRQPGGSDRASSVCSGQSRFISPSVKDMLVFLSRRMRAVQRSFSVGSFISRSTSSAFVSRFLGEGLASHPFAATMHFSR